jgi:choice-of-anchor C domain-containing protein
VATVTNLSVSGDFECPPVTASYQTFTGGQALCGWLVKGQSIDLVGSLWPAAEGQQSVDLTGSPGAGAIEQCLLTAPGQSYRIRFALAGNILEGPARKELVVEWDNRELDTQSFDITGRSAANMGWDYRELTATATSSATCLVFRSLTEGSYGPVIDDVSVVPARSAVVSPVTGAVAAPAPARFGTPVGSSGATRAGRALLPADQRRPRTRLAARSG